MVDGFKYLGVLSQPMADPSRGKTGRQDITSRFVGYEFRIYWPSTEPYNPDSEMLDVRVRTQGGSQYQANFTTLAFLHEIFEKNKKTGELASGTYFCMPNNMVIVTRLTEDNIRKTIDDLIRNLEIEDFFHPIEEVQ